MPESSFEVARATSGGTPWTEGKGVAGRLQNHPITRFNNAVQGAHPAR
jgi:hypothetical protein